MKKNRSHALVPALALLALACSSAPPPADATSGATAHHDADAPLILPPDSDTYEVLGALDGLGSFAVKYDDRLYRGGDPRSAKGADTLAALGVRTLVSITPTDAGRALAEERGFDLVEIPFDMKAGIAAGDLKRFLDLFAGDAPPVYVHGRDDTHRAGALGVAYRVHAQGWDWDKAILEFGLLGGSLKDDQTILQSVLRYEP